VLAVLAVARGWVGFRFAGGRMSLHVDQFDEDEFPDVPKRRRRCWPPEGGARSRKPWGLRHQLPEILAIAGCAVIAGARSFGAIIAE